MADEMFNLDKMKSDEEAAIKQQNIALDVAQAEMADQRAYEAEQARQQMIGQGFKGLTTAATALGDAIDPFAKLGAGKAAGGAAGGASGGAAGGLAAKRFAPSLGSGNMAKGLSDMRSQYMPTESIFAFGLGGRGGLNPPGQGFGQFGLTQPPVLGFRSSRTR